MPPDVVIVNGVVFNADNVVLVYAVLATAPVDPTYPNGTILADDQLIVVVVAVTESVKLTDAANNVYPTLGESEIDVNHPLGGDEMVLFDHV